MLYINYYQQNWKWEKTHVLTIFKKYKVHIDGGITVAVESRGHVHL